MAPFQSCNFINAGQSPKDHIPSKIPLAIHLTMLTRIQYKNESKITVPFNGPI